MKRQFGVTHGIAECQDCDWGTQSYKNAQALAARHAMAWGHKVNGEVGYSYTYDGASSMAPKRKKGKP